MKPLLPGSTIGVLGSGQLGRMFAISARRLGYRVHTYSPESDTPTGQVSDLEVTGSYDDLDAIRRFAKNVQAVTFEFENVSAAAAAAAAEVGPVRPSGNVLHITQHRLREKTFLKAHRFPVTPFETVTSPSELARAAKAMKYRAVLKTAGFGYDGKGQQKISSVKDTEGAWERLGTREAVLEAWVDYQCEISVVVARGLDGSTATYDVFQNEHKNHILDITVSPAVIPAKLAAQAKKLAVHIAKALDVIGVLCVEMFVTKDGKILVNELAPRPHNSGHLTFDAAVTSQFEQQLRAVCGLPLGSTALTRPAAMANLLGDLWQQGTPNWPKALKDPDIKLHLYGKLEARPGRKMGHLTALASSSAEARRKVIAARKALLS